MKSIKFIGPQRQREPKDKIDQWIAIHQETCLFCAEPLLVQNHKDSVKYHYHVTGKYRGAPHNECNLKLKLNAKPVPIPVVLHNLKGYDSHLPMQAMARVLGKIKCVPTNTEKYISFSLGDLRFIDSVNFLLSSLDAVVKGNLRSCSIFVSLVDLSRGKAKRKIESDTSLLRSVYRPRF